MTSTQKGITLRGSAELVADFFCKLHSLLVTFDHAGLRRYEAYGSAN